MCGGKNNFTHGARVERKQEAREGTKQRRKRVRPHIGSSIRLFLHGGNLEEATVETERFSIGRLLLNDDVAA
jgi:hypothetical protein